MSTLYRITFTRKNGNKCIGWMKGSRREATKVANATFLDKADDESFEAVNVEPEREYTLEEVKAMGVNPRPSGGKHEYIEFENQKS